MKVRSKWINTSTEEYFCGWDLEEGGKGSSNLRKSETGHNISRLFAPVFAIYSGSVGVKLCNAWDASSRMLLKKIRMKKG